MFPSSKDPDASVPSGLLSFHNPHRDTGTCHFVRAPTNLCWGAHPVAHAITFVISANMAAADVDVGSLSAHLGVPQETLQTVTTTPTADLVKAVLQAVAQKAQEYNALYSEKLSLDIELETTVRNSEARTQQFKATAEKALQDVEEARQKLKDEGGF